MIEFDYRCSVCSKPTQREFITVKKISFLEIGMNGRAIKTRTESWLCPECLSKDPGWKIPKNHMPGKAA